MDGTVSRHWNARRSTKWRLIVSISSIFCPPHILGMLAKNVTEIVNQRLTYFKIFKDKQEAKTFPEIFHGGKGQRLHKHLKAG
jgi:hypothetical protein